MNPSPHAKTTSPRAGASLATVLADVDAASLTSTVVHLADDFGPRTVDAHATFASTCRLGGTRYATSNYDRAVAWVTAQVRAMGYPAGAVQEEQVPGLGANVVVTKRGTSDPNTYIEVGAHLDSVSSGPGADDNASGVAAVLEVARVLRNQATRLSIRFVLYAGEEHDLQGSRWHVKTALARGDQIDVALTIDSAGWARKTPQGRYVDLVWDGGLRTAEQVVAGMSATAGTYRLPVSITASTAGWGESDQSAYWERGINAVASLGGYDNPSTYHRCTDTPAPDNFSAESTRLVAQLTAASALQLATAPSG